MVLLLFSESTHSFWTNPFDGGSTNDATNGVTGTTSCPKWAAYFEVANTTVECNRAARSFLLQGGIFCDNICEEVRGIS